MAWRAFDLYGGVIFSLTNPLVDSLDQSDIDESVPTLLARVREPTFVTWLDRRHNLYWGEESAAPIEGAYLNPVSMGLGHWSTEVTLITQPSAMRPSGYETAIRVNIGGHTDASSHPPLSSDLSSGIDRAGRHASERGDINEDPDNLASITHTTERVIKTLLYLALEPEIQSAGAGDTDYSVMVTGPQNYDTLVSPDDLFLRPNARHVLQRGRFTRGDGGPRHLIWHKPGLHPEPIGLPEI